MPERTRTRVTKRQAPSGIALEILHGLVKDRLTDLNEGQKIGLQRLAELNKISDFLANQMRTLVEASQELAAKERNDAADAPKVSVTWQKPDTRSLDSQGKVLVIEARSGSHTSATLGAELIEAANCMEEVRNRKQMEQTAFEQLDKMTNETMNTLSRVMRALGEARQTGAGGK